MQDAARAPEGLEPNNQLSFFDVIIEIVRSWKIIIAFFAACVVASLLYLHFSNYRYTAELRVSPAQSNGGSLASKLGGLAGLASISGVSIPQDSGAVSYALYLEGLKSRYVATQLAQRPEVMTRIFANEWNPEERRFHEPSGPRVTIVRGVKELLGLPIYPWEAPNAARLQEHLESAVKIQQNTKTSIATITYSHGDPAFAATLLGALHEAADDELRRKARIRSGEYVRYLSEQLRTVSLAEHRVALSQALAEQERMRMMSSSGLPFAADPLGPATASLRPTSPRPAIIIVFGALFGLVLGVAVALLRLQVTARFADSVKVEG